MKRLRQLFESIAYAGMKPGGTQSPSPAMRWLGPLRGPVERFLNGPASSDPFYLTNRTTGQKARLAAVICVPFALVLGGVALAAIGYFDDGSQLPPPTKQLSNAEIAAKMLPDLNKDMHLETNHDLQVLDVTVGGNKISGSVKNASSHAINDAEVVFDLTDARGSRVGAISCRLARIEASTSIPFHADIAQANAVYALVREVRTQ
jgi:hypothetical protein